MKRLVIATCLMFLLVFATATAQGQNQSTNGKLRRLSRAIPNQYIVVFKKGLPREDVRSAVDELLLAHGGILKHVYQHAIKGFAVSLPESLALAISKDPRVEYV